MWQKKENVEILGLNVSYKSALTEKEKDLTEGLHSASDAEVKSMKVLSKVICG